MPHSVRDFNLRQEQNVFTSLLEMSSNSSSSNVSITAAPVGVASPSATASAPQTSLADRTVATLLSQIVDDVAARVVESLLARAHTPSSLLPAGGVPTPSSLPSSGASAALPIYTAALGGTHSAPISSPGTLWLS